VGYRVEASDRIVSAWQDPHVGDVIADGPLGGHAGRPSSCQPHSMTTGRRSKVQVAPPTPVLSREYGSHRSDSPPRSRGELSSC
jgi:hypothetical protein